jgi:hypothetical protein
VPEFHHLASLKAKFGFYDSSLTHERDQTFISEPGNFVHHVPKDRPGELKVRRKCFATVGHFLSGSGWPEEADNLNQGTSNESTYLLWARWYNRCRDFLSSHLSLANADRGRAKESPGLFERERNPKMPAQEMEILCLILRSIAPVDLPGTLDPQISPQSMDCRPEKLSTMCSRAVVPQRLWHKPRPSRNLCVIECTNGQIRALWAPPSVKVGDHVCYLAGIPYPFVARPRKNDTGCYQLIGDASTSRYHLDDADVLDIDATAFDSLTNWIATCKKEDSNHDEEMVEQPRMQRRALCRKACEGLGWLRFT